MNRVEMVRLNAEERALFDEICWKSHELGKMGDTFAHLDKMAELAESLFKRNAIPRVRLAYFTEPEMNVGGHGRSRKQVFEKNGTSGPAIFRHPHFMAYLRYFICGPDLPLGTIEGFCKIIDDDAGTSGMILDQIRTYVRKEVRGKGLNPRHAAEEFFKLACEIGEPSLAENARSAARTAKRL